MRYLKLFEAFKESDLKRFEEMFYDLSDIGYDIIVEEQKTAKMPSGVSICSRSKLKGVFPCIYVTIRKDIFNLEEVKENLLFAESYCVEIGYKLNWIACDYILEKSTDYMFLNSANLLNNDASETDVDGLLFATFLPIE